MAATLHAFKGYPGAALWSTSPKHARAIWARAVTSVVVDDNDVELQPCHCGRGCHSTSLRAAALWERLIGLSSRLASCFWLI